MRKKGEREREIWEIKEDRMRYERNTDSLGRRKNDKSRERERNRKRHRQKMRQRKKERKR